MTKTIKIMYRVRLNAPTPEGLITRVEIEREDKLRVWINGKFFRRSNSLNRLFDDWKAAQAFLYQSVKARIRRLDEKLESSKALLLEIPNLTEPEAEI